MRRGQKVLIITLMNVAAPDLKDKKKQKTETLCYTKKLTNLANLQAAVNYTM